MSEGSPVHDCSCAVLVVDGFLLLLLHREPGVASTRPYSRFAFLFAGDPSALTVNVRVAVPAVSMTVDVATVTSDVVVPPVLVTITASMVVVTVDGAMGNDDEQ